MKEYTEYYNLEKYTESGWMVVEHSHDDLQKAIDAYAKYTYLFPETNFRIIKESTHTFIVVQKYTKGGTVSEIKTIGF